MPHRGPGTGLIGGRTAAYSRPHQPLRWRPRTCRAGKAGAIDQRPAASDYARTPACAFEKGLPRQYDLARGSSRFALPEGDRWRPAGGEAGCINGPGHAAAPLGNCAAKRPASAAARIRVLGGTARVAGTNQRHHRHPRKPRAAGLEAGEGSGTVTVAHRGANGLQRGSRSDRRGGAACVRASDQVSPSLGLIRSAQGGLAASPKTGRSAPAASGPCLFQMACRNSAPFPGAGQGIQPCGTGARGCPWPTPC